LSSGLSALVAVSAVALAGAHALLDPPRALACGGCFAPTGTPNIVTAHRMAVAMGTRETTLWDQIRYAGSPEEFAWVLPVAPGTRVELADNAFFEALDRQTRITMTAPFPPLPCFGDAGGFGCGSSGDAASRVGGAPSSPWDAGVTVMHEAVIGPYETVTISGDDARNLVTWLRGRGYAVPDEITPTIMHYVGMGMAFAALRLRPGVGVQQMQPVRVTQPGLGTTFPLRMVAAGATAELTLELYVFAESRSETKNVATVEVPRGEVTYDWDTGAFDYDARFREAITRGGGNAWVAEYADYLPYEARSYVSYDPVTGSPSFPTDDFAIVDRAVGEVAFLTKLRTELSPNLLDRDLILGAAATDAILPASFSVTRERNRPLSCEEMRALERQANFEGCAITRRRGTHGRDRHLVLGALLVGAPALALALRVLARRRRR
jgi:hypothetical protein